MWRYYTKYMVRKHTIKKETNYNAETGNISITEEHVIIEKHDFLAGKDEEDGEEDMYFLRNKKDATASPELDEPTLYIFSDDDKFW